MNPDNDEQMSTAEKQMSTAEKVGAARALMNGAVSIKDAMANGRLAGRKFYGFLICLALLAFALYNGVEPEKLPEVAKAIAYLYAPFTVSQGVADLARGKSTLASVAKSPS